MDFRQGVYTQLLAAFLAPRRLFCFVGIGFRGQGKAFGLRQL